ncbi:hypothetical protein GGF50DRAFT_121632 [Schizophyllum commune]
MAPSSSPTSSHSRTCLNATASAFFSTTAEDSGSAKSDAGSSIMPPEAATPASEAKEDEETAWRSAMSNPLLIAQRDRRAGVRRLQAQFPIARKYKAELESQTHEENESP